MIGRILFFLCVIFFLYDSPLNGQTGFSTAPVYNDYQGSSAQKSKDNSPFDISYSIEPFYDINAFRFIVVLEFKGEKSGETKIILPGEYGGQNNGGGIKYLKALSENTYILDTDRPEYKIVRHPSGANIKIYYQVEELRKGDIELGNHYMVVLKRNYFHFLGETFFIVPAWDSGTEYKFRLNWNHMPSNWNMANSFGANEKYQSVKLPLWKFRYSIFTGGDFRIVKRTIGNYPFYLSIRGKWNFSDDQLSDMIKEIFRTERDFWRDFNFPYYLISVLPIEGNGDQGGTGRTNSYGLFLSKDRTLDYRLKRVIAHETFHTWLGEKIQFAEPEPLVYWFKEGFADYYARLILLRSYQINLNDYIEEYNKVLNQYYTSSVRYEKNERLVSQFWSDSDMMRLPYQRGDIIAHNLNTAIIKNSGGIKSLDDLMRDLFKRSQNESLVVSNGSLSALVRFYAGDQALSEIMRTLNSGATLKANPDALGPCVSMETSSYRKFWLFGEYYEVPVYQLRNENASPDKKCLEWFGMK